MADVAENALFTDPVAAISQGKRHLLVRDYGMAVTALAQACELLAQKHGDTSDELGEPFILYGRALLALAREETGVLGGAVPGSDEVEAEAEAEEELDEEDDNANEEKDDEDEDEEHEVKKSNGAATEAEKEALANNEANAKADSTTRSESNDLKEAKAESAVATAAVEAKESSAAQKKDETPVPDEKKESSTPEKKPSESDATSTKDAKKDTEEETGKEAKAGDEKPDSTESKENIEPETSSASTSGDKKTSKVKENGEASGNEEEDGEDVSKEEEEEDINNLQLAWEILESGKLILLKRGPPGWKHLAEAHRLLGEVAMESGNHQGALIDLQACLDLLAKIEPCDPRAIAETYYQLGLAYSLANEFDASIEQFKEATSLLQSHIQQLEETKDSHKNDDPFYTVEGEIKELKELLPEIQEKIADMKDFKEEACKAMVEGIKSKVAAGCLNGAGPSGDGASSSAESSSTSQIKPASDISHLVRKKRKADESEKAEVGSPCKKPTP